MYKLLQMCSVYYHPDYVVNRMCVGGILKDIDTYTDKKETHLSPIPPSRGLLVSMSLSFQKRLYV